MPQILLKTAGALLLKMFSAAASEAMLEWLLFKVADMITASTKTPVDDEWLAKLKESYETSKNK